MNTQSTNTQAHEDDWLEAARAHTEERYRHLLGKQPRAGNERLAFGRCGCAMLELAPPELGTRPIVCSNCKQNADRYGPVEVEHFLPKVQLQFQSNRWVFAIILLLLGALWIGNSVAHAPSRDDAMRAMEPAL